MQALVEQCTGGQKEGQVDALKISDVLPVPTANLLRRAAVLPREAQPRTAAGRRWLRAYLNGCAHPPTALVVLAGVVQMQCK